MLRKGDLTQGGITGTLLHFTLPMMVGSFLQQCYNIADTLIVGQCIGAGALAAVGSAYTLMVFLMPTACLTLAATIFPSRALI